MTDLGSIVYEIVRDNGNVATYAFEGLSTDYSKLQTATAAGDFPRMATGSSFLGYNPTKVYKFNKNNQTWYEL